jgi:hypothetical protein
MAARLTRLTKNTTERDIQHIQDAAKTSQDIQRHHSKSHQKLRGQTGHQPAKHSQFRARSWAPVAARTQCSAPPPPPAARANQRHARQSSGGKARGSSTIMGSPTPQSAVSRRDQTGGHSIRDNTAPERPRQSPSIAAPARDAQEQAEPQEPLLRLRQRGRPRVGSRARTCRFTSSAAEATQPKERRVGQRPWRIRSCPWHPTNSINAKDQNATIQETSSMCMADEGSTQSRRWRHARSTTRLTQSETDSPNRRVIDWKLELGTGAVKKAITGEDNRCPSSLKRPASQIPSTTDENSINGRNRLHAQRRQLRHHDQHCGPHLPHSALNQKCEDISMKLDNHARSGSLFVDTRLTLPAQRRPLNAARSTPARRPLIDVYL